jgi:hypothetical protein
VFPPTPRLSVIVTAWPTLATDVPRAKASKCVIYRDRRVTLWPFSTRSQPNVMKGLPRVQPTQPSRRGFFALIAGAFVARFAPPVKLSEALLAQGTGIERATYSFWRNQAPIASSRELTYEMLRSVHERYR